MKSIRWWKLTRDLQRGASKIEVKLRSGCCQARLAIGYRASQETPNVLAGKLITDALKSYRAAADDLEISGGLTAADGTTIEPRRAGEKYGRILAHSTRRFV